MQLRAVEIRDREYQRPPVRTPLTVRRQGGRIVAHAEIFEAKPRGPRCVEHHELPAQGNRTRSGIAAWMKGCDIRGVECHFESAFAGLQPCRERSHAHVIRRTRDLGAGQLRAHGPTTGARTGIETQRVEFTGSGSPATWQCQHTTVATRRKQLCDELHRHEGHALGRERGACDSCRAGVEIKRADRLGARSRRAPRVSCRSAKRSRKSSASRSSLPLTVK